MKNPIIDIAGSYQPIIWNLSIDKDINELNKLRESGEILFEVDEFDRQLRDLYKCRYPDKVKNEEQFNVFLVELSNGKQIQEIGRWVYYPWRKTLVHLLAKEEFIEVRTNRNKLKILQEEQDDLSSKTVGIIGLSVGQSVAVTLAMERSFGKIKLADYDTLDLSNLNRLRTGVFNLGIPKVILAAREITEIDPYIEVEIFPEGINSENYHQFLQGTGKLDLLVEVCDNFEVKVESRIRARKLGIPVIMETNDRGMLDVERFDQDQSMQIFHGLVSDIDINNINDLDTKSRMEILMKIVNAPQLSDRMKLSIPEIGKSINSWPQLASEVVLGAGISAWACRKLLLGEYLPSGRYYIDLEQILSLKKR